jgi:hypothetical protein
MLRTKKMSLLKKLKKLLTELDELGVGYVCFVIVSLLGLAAALTRRLRK